MGGLEWWHIVLIAMVFMLLFGYRKLPSATKSIAQSLKIFRDETKGLRGDDHDEVPPAGSHASHDTIGALAAPSTLPAPAPVVVPAVTPEAVPAPVVVAPPAAAQPSTAAQAPAPVAPPSPAGGSLAPRPGAYASGGQPPR